MTFALVLFLVFIFYHLSTVIVLSAVLNTVGKVSSWQPSTKQSYYLWLGMFLVVTVYPVLQTSWHAEGLSEAMLRSTILSAPALNYEVLPLSQLDMTAAAAATTSTNPAANLENSMAPPFVLISNSSNVYYIADQLAYLLVPLSSLLFFVLVVGALVSVIRTFRLLLATAWLIHRSDKVQLPPHICSNIFLPVLSNAKISTPMAAGVFHPVILLPSNMLMLLNDQQLHHVLLHEQVHHQRRDLWVSVVLRLASAAYWWSPSLRSVNKKIKLCREMICDEQAAKQAGDNIGYAQSLLDCAKISFVQRSIYSSSYIGVELVGYGSDLSQRISGLLNFKKPRHSLGLFLSLLACFCLSAGSYVSNASRGLLESEIIVRITQQHQLLDPGLGRALIEAVDQENITEIERLISEGLNPNVPIDVHGTALMVAVNNGSLLMVQELLRLGANPNQAAARRGNPLILASIRADKEIAAALLGAGADINVIVPRDETPLIKAAHYGQLEMVQYLVENGAEVNLGVRTSVHDGFEYRTALSRASSEEIKSFLAAAGAI
ncbi:MAG: hypothetical protein COA96_15270 [SAR86 cluster bacterium]|uniref:Peptidase M56 domain-containing protein n=1 Tax=SAR86 cluster bacterium TaxID=2030880 RepID=A0A2A5ARI7_9GAMM|nr:MAG: hypothetical protein COA96_15270 [SAR86 cluster bacterium]